MLSILVHCEPAVPAEKQRGRTAKQPATPVKGGKCIYRHVPLASDSAAPVQVAAESSSTAILGGYSAASSASGLPYWAVSSLSSATRRWLGQPALPAIMCSARSALSSGAPARAADTTRLCATALRQSADRLSRHLAADRNMSLWQCGSGRGRQWCVSQLNDILLHPADLLLQERRQAGAVPVAHHVIAEGEPMVGAGHLNSSRRRGR